MRACVRSILVASLINYGVSELEWGWRVSWACAGAAPGPGMSPMLQAISLGRSQPTDWKVRLCVQNQDQRPPAVVLLRLGRLSMQVRCSPQ